MLLQTLLEVLKLSKAATMMELQQELEAARQEMLAAFVSGSLHNQSRLANQSPISMLSGCEIFERHVTRSSVEFPDFDECKRVLTKRGTAFAQKTRNSRSKIAEIGAHFVPDGARVLVHGRSRVVSALLGLAVRAGSGQRSSSMDHEGGDKNFEVFCTEGRPLQTGKQMAVLLRDQGIPVTLVPDSAIAYIMEGVDLVLVGAEGVLESGGIVNRLGTAAVATIAKSLSKPFYVAAESYKFARVFPLSQRDLPSYCTQNLAEEEGSLAPACDYTRAEYITLLFTDLGVLTPAAVSDELIKLYV